MEKAAPALCLDAPTMQKGGTCYAHAVATAVRSVDAAVFGRPATSYDDLLGDIVRRYGCKGANTEQVAKSFRGAPHHVQVNKVGPEGVASALRGNPLPRVILMSFRLAEVTKNKTTEYNMWESFFTKHVKTCLTSSRYEKCKSEMDCAVAAGGKAEWHGHAVAIVAETETAWVIKNSWGEKWGVCGFGLVDKDPDLYKHMSCQFLDCFYTVNDLPQHEVDRFNAASPKERDDHEKGVLRKHRRILSCVPGVKLHPHWPA
jgi:hypothetical protein